MITLLFLPISWAKASTPALYNIDAAKSRIEIRVYRSGILKVAGHDHKIAARSFSGEVLFDPLKIADSSISLNIESRSLTVLDPDVSEKEREEVQTTMLGARVLHIEEFPEIQFRSTKVSHLSGTGEDFLLTGKLLLHGMDKEIAFPVHLHIEQNLLQATGTVAINQTDFGMEPIAIGLGMIRVADKIQINFDCLAERAIP